MQTAKVSELNNPARGAERSSDEREDPSAAIGGEDLIAAVLEYAEASKQVFSDKVSLFESRVKLSLARLQAGALGAVGALVLILTGWILAMVGISQVLASWIGIPGVSILIVAAFNVVAGLFAAQFARTMLQRAAAFGEQEGAEK